MTRRLALITGASAGIGEAFARLYAKRGCDLVLVARREDKLNDLADTLELGTGAKSLVIPADLSDPNAVDHILAKINAKGHVVDVLVNNAGYGLPDEYADTSWQDQADFLQVMLTAPCELAHKVLPGMLERRWGRIVNVSSLAGFAPGSRGHTLYAAVKAGLIKFSQSLNVECENTGVHVTAVCPGFTYSEFHDVNGTRDQMNKLPNYMWQSADDVALTGFEASANNRAVIVTGGVNKGLAALTKIMPDPLALHIMKQRGTILSKD